ncbi:Alpha/Beta hydrolase protein [Macrophomina phaseolina]|uniref:Alpha/Beta hydrolase protein n=1 Tax=Macrophomina phaseolina TaxID=35725 RepID=A0ABQ8G7T7_9PEZI|nr:Alpha/Beta hydrolase protein [Macrophomina phaseolina]
MSPNRRDRDTTALDAKPKPASSLGKTLWHGFMLSCGLLAGLSWLLLMLRDGVLFQRRSRRVTEKELADARNRLWNLSSQPIPNFTHAFFTTPDDHPVTLHYVVSAWDAGPCPNLVVLLHGFPDSWALWKTFLSDKRNLDPETVYVALDLPGYGGSDSLAKYDAYNVLEAVTSFILGMRERYGVDGGEGETVSGGGAVGAAGAVGEERGRVVVVSHDWGGALASRLASEAPQLADHFVLASIVLPRLFIANAQARISSVRRMCHTWTQQPLNFRLLRNSWKTLQPLVSQLRKSYYIFAFNLPDLPARVLGSFTGAWFLSKIHRVASYNINSPTNESVIKEAAEALASSLGPGISQCKTAISPPLSSIPEKQAAVYDNTPTAYPSTVHSRAASASHAWFQKTRYYRDGLILGRWTKSLQTILSLSVLDSSNSTLVGSSTATSPTSGKFITSPNHSSAKLAEQPTNSLTNGTSPDEGGTPLRHRRRRSSAGLYSSSLYASRTNNNSRRSSLSVGASLFDAAGAGPLGALRAPATLVVGQLDVAFDWRLGLEGVADYLPKGGAVVMCERAGHWLVREEVGLEVLRRVVGAAVGSEVVLEEGEGEEGVAGSLVVVDGGQGFGSGGVGGVKGLLRGLEGVKVTVDR